MTFSHSTTNERGSCGRSDPIQAKLKWSLWEMTVAVGNVEAIFKDICLYSNPLFLLLSLECHTLLITIWIMKVKDLCLQDLQFSCNTCSFSPSQEFRLLLFNIDDIPPSESQSLNPIPMRFTSFSGCFKTTLIANEEAMDVSFILYKLYQSVQRLVFFTKFSTFLQDVRLMSFFFSNKLVS